MQYQCAPLKWRLREKKTHTREHAIDCFSITRALLFPVFSCQNFVELHLSSTKTQLYLFPLTLRSDTLTLLQLRGTTYLQRDDHLRPSRKKKKKHYVPAPHPPSSATLDPFFSSSKLAPPRSTPVHLPSLKRKKRKTTQEAHTQQHAENMSGDIPKSYIRRGTTAAGGTRWNVRCYDKSSRQTVTLGTFADKSTAEAAFKAGNARLNEKAAGEGKKEKKEEAPATADEEKHTATTTTTSVTTPPKNNESGGSSGGGDGCGASGGSGGGDHGDDGGGDDDEEKNEKGKARAEDAKKDGGAARGRDDFTKELYEADCALAAADAWGECGHVKSRLGLFSWEEELVTECPECEAKDVEEAAAAKLKKEMQAAAAAVAADRWVTEEEAPAPTTAQARVPLTTPRDKQITRLFFPPLRTASCLSRYAKEKKQVLVFGIFSLQQTMCRSI